MQTLFQFLLPQHFLSRFAGYIAYCKVSWVKKILIEQFIKYYQVDMSVALKDKSEDYSHFNEFFTRALKPEKRLIASELTSIVSPVDGTVSQFGDIKEGYLIQAKKINYKLQDFLGGSATLASFFKNGKFATFYLSPKDYHRVHSPIAGKLDKMIYVPGRLFSVNRETTNNLPRLFVRNERVICLFSTKIGPVAVILVGAMLVASISTAWEGVIAPSNTRRIHHWCYRDLPVTLDKGEELGKFQLGSTVIVLFPKNSIQWAAEFNVGKQVEYGECIANVQLLE